jgi:hypothetical protein
MALQTLQMVEASSSHKRPPVQLLVIEETSVEAPLHTTLCVILKKESSLDETPSKEDFLQLVMKSTTTSHHHSKPIDPLKVRFHLVQQQPL